MMWQHVCIVGNGRAGKTFAAALARAGLHVSGPLQRGEAVVHADVYLLCVPEHAINAAAATLPPGALAGHCSASSSLDVLEPHEAFSIHPLMTLHGELTDLAGSSCAVDGSTPRAVAVATQLAEVLGMKPIRVPDGKRALYHAAASMASNFLVTLEDAAEAAALECGVPRAALLPLVAAAMNSWAANGFHGAITGPIARNDFETVARQRAAIATSLPHLIPLFDVMTNATSSALARTSAAVASSDATESQ